MYIAMAQCRDLKNYTFNLQIPVGVYCNGSVQGSKELYFQFTDSCRCVLQWLSEL